MSKQLLHSPIILCFLLTSLPFLVISQSPSSELKILLNIKEQWGNPRALQSWNATTSHCQWPGIKCASDRTVTGVSLGNQNITGEFPPSICDLNNLTTLDLGSNYLGGLFPTVLYKCTNLQNLNLTENLFVGQLPNDISNLSSSLQHLDLSYNNFTGDIPSSIGQLKRLITLHLEWNLFNGAFPSDMGDLENLEELVLAFNSFSPMELPTEFGELKSIRFLWMTKCNLIGKIPESLGNLYSLEHLNLANNNLEGGIPSGLFLLENLRLLYLYNNTLTGKFPTSIEARNLVEIDVSNNTITGTIPQGIGNLPRLEILNLFGNQFYGILPPSIGLLPMLKTIKLWNNKFSGPLPAELGRHSRLQHFEVSDNQFTGHLPEDLCSGGALLGVVAFNNQLNGSIPKSLGQCNSLRTVQLNNNYFSGEIPEGLWSLQDMSVLKLSNNQLFGRLSNKLAQKLTWIEISNNRFFGEIPSNATFWDQLVTFEASNNRISGSIPLELTSLSKLNSLSLDGNHLSGELPSKILSWVNLNRLNLSRNELSGSIPSALGLLPVLNSLDLSINHFSGQIPPELGLLKLSLFNVSSNKLTGRIPYGYDNAAYHTSFLNTSLCSVSGLLDLPRCKSLRENAQNFPPMYLALIVVLGFMGIAYFSWFIFFKILKGKHAYDMSSKLTPFQRIDFTEQKILANITENNLIGSGGSGKVYKIPVNESGNVVAAKRIWNKKTRNEKEFLAEVETLSTIRHVNIIKLLCCISREDSKILVYEYMENHSLDKWIHERKRKDASWMDGSVAPKVLDWPRRLRIAVGVAKGLRYMHHDCSRTIIHRDVKSSNVLLDSEFNAKIADFGLARILDKPTGEPDTMFAFAGSFGYMAPEYSYSTKLNEKIDIYSFGVVLLELVTGKEPHKGDDEYSNLAQWAWRHYSQGHPIADALDEQVKDDRCLEEMIFVFMLGLKCTSTCPCCRPSMKEVLQLLRRCNSLEGPEGAIDLNESDSVSALLGNGRHFSSCRNSKKEIKEDDHIIVTIL